MCAERDVGRVCVSPSRAAKRASSGAVRREASRTPISSTAERVIPRSRESRLISASASSDSWYERAPRGFGTARSIPSATVGMDVSRETADLIFLEAMTALGATVLSRIAGRPWRLSS